MFGQLTTTTQDLAGLSDDVLFTYAYDVLGRKASVAAKIGTTDDYVNTYAYDALGRATQITQAGVTGGNAVAEKRVDFAYSDNSTQLTISRFADLAGTKAEADTDQFFDQLGRVTDIVHRRGTTKFADYGLVWGAAGRLTDFDFTSLVGDNGTGDYTYDDTSQLTGADYDFQTDESYTYDANGNRTITGYTTGDHNRLTSDGTYNYTYDNEGNVTAKTNISTSESVEYTWDHRNRLTKVTFKNSSGVATKIVEYFYDHAQRWVRKTLDTNADGTIEESRIFVYDAGQIVLDFDKTGTGDASNADLTHRYLWGPAVDQILADEQLTSTSTPGNVLWPLTDHLGTVRDLADFHEATETTAIANHLTYDAFGRIISETNAAVDHLFAFTGRDRDEESDLYHYRARYYDPATGRFIGEDPIGFDAGDANLYRYVGNGPTNGTDPSGLEPPQIRPWYFVNPEGAMAYQNGDTNGVKPLTWSEYRGGVIAPPPSGWEHGIFRKYYSDPKTLQKLGLSADEASYVTQMGGGCFRFAQARLGMIDPAALRAWREGRKNERGIAAGLSVPRVQHADGARFFHDLREAERYYWELRHAGADPRIFAYQSTTPIGDPPAGFQPMDGYPSEVDLSQLPTTMYNYSVRHWDQRCAKWYWEWQQGPGGAIANSWYQLSQGDNYVDVVYGVFVPPYKTRALPAVPPDSVRPPMAR